jgi:hypothetical protein
MLQMHQRHQIQMQIQPNFMPPTPDYYQLPPPQPQPPLFYPNPVPQVAPASYMNMIHYSLPQPLYNYSMPVGYIYGEPAGCQKENLLVDNRQGQQQYQQQYQQQLSNQYYPSGLPYPQTYGSDDVSSCSVEGQPCEVHPCYQGVQEQGQGQGRQNQQGQVVKYVGNKKRSARDAFNH